MPSDNKIHNTLFNEILLEEYLEKYENKLKLQNLEGDPIQVWIDKLNNNLLADEVSNYPNFEEYILKQLLGYNIEDYLHEVNMGEGRPVEFVLKKDEKLFVVIELKGTDTESLEKRYGKRQSPVEQACNYANVKEETKWAIVSNYEEFRLINPSSRENYISFNFRDLSDEKILKTFLLIFSKFSLIDEDIPTQLLENTIIKEKDFENEFYELYSETRLMLIKELEESEDNFSKEEAIHYAQLILNRYIFICFIEDFHLIPPQTSTDTIKTPIDNNNLFDFTIWDRLNELFRFVDKGNSRKGIPQFNGGLFSENLANLKIRDEVENSNEFFKDCYKEWQFEEKYEEIKGLLGDYENTINPIYKNLLIISEFNFSTERDVNILGHIFEKSIGAIENLKKNRRDIRRSEGLYYIPPNITDFICNNAIYSYLSKTGYCNSIENLLEEYENELENLYEKLINIKIVDPACGSGSFLNKCADILLELHKVLYEMKNTEPSTPIDLTEKRIEILSNNIYGVDKNKESVELTKLSMFLKVAKRDLQLPNLDNNIKCGNSIIDNPDIVGDEAFNWKEEFHDVFECGGFDIVLSAPPHGAKIPKNQREYLNNLINKGGETSISFTKISMDNLLNDDGFLGFIIPKAFLYSSKFEVIRNEILNNLHILIDLQKTIKEVKHEQAIMILTKTEFNDFYYSGKLDNELIEIKEKIPKSACSNFNIFLNNVSQEELELGYKIQEFNKYINDIATNSRGQNGLQQKLTKNGELEVIGGKEIQRFGVVAIKGFIDKNEISSSNKAFIKNNSVLVQNILSHVPKADTIKITACIPNKKDFILTDTINQIVFDEDYNPKFFWRLFNSKLINWYTFRFIYARAIRDMHFDNVVTEKIPLPHGFSLENELVIATTNKCEELYSLQNEVRRNKYSFFKVLRANFDGIRINRKLFNFENLKFKEFEKELIRQGKELSVNFKIPLKNSEEWIDFFDEHKRVCNEINSKINENINELDSLIYELYGLENKDEIDMIEGIT